MLSIIVLSSDGYSDCWEPFFKLYKKNFPGIENYEILLSTNSKTFEYPGLNIKSIKQGDIAWSKRLRNALLMAKNDTVFIAVEDSVLRKKMDKNGLQGFIDLLKNDSKIDHIRLLSTRDRTKVKRSTYSNLDEIEPKTKLRFAYLPGLWKKKVILKYVIDFESIFLSEKLGNIRSWIYKDGFYAVSKEYIKNNGLFYDCLTSGTLVKGKWAKWVAPFFKENDIIVDFNIRGFATEEFIRNSRKNSKLQLLKNPVTTFRSLISISGLFLKSLIVRQR